MTAFDIHWPKYNIVEKEFNQTPFLYEDPLESHLAISTEEIERYISIPENGNTCFILNSVVKGRDHRQGPLMPIGLSMFPQSSFPR